MRELEPSLQQFGEFLLRAHLVRPNAAPFVVRWVRRFLSRPATDESVADQVRRFCEDLSVPDPERKRWGESRERVLLQRGAVQPTKEVPLLEHFATRFIEADAVANRQKPSEVVSKRSILNAHLIPAFGGKRLDAITNADVQGSKHVLRDNRAPKTVNNVLTVLRVLLKRAVEWDIVDRVPCTIRLLKVTKPNCVVQRSEWHGHVTTPKRGRLRYVPMTTRLVTALRAHRHPKGGRVLCRDDGTAVSHDIVAKAVRRAAKAANVPVSGAHRLRHTFCSHLAMRGAPAGAIQEALATRI